MKKSRLALAASVALLATTTGCAGVHPGVAAKVGGSSITTKQVDDLTNVQCGHQEMNSTPQLRSSVQQQVLETLIQAKETELYAKAHGITVPQKDVATALQQVVARSEKFAKPLTGKDRTVFNDAFEQIITAQDLITKIGKQELAAKGQSTSNSDQVSNAAQHAIGSWATRQGITVNPKYAPTQGQAGGGSISLSTAVSWYAKKAAADPSGAKILAHTPANLICQ